MRINGIRITQSMNRNIVSVDGFATNGYSHLIRRHLHETTSTEIKSLDVNMI